MLCIAVNEENASISRVVTAPTNGAAGVIPVVMLYHICFSGSEIHEYEIVNFLMIADEMETFFKKKATISAAMGGCQAEICVSSAMAAIKVINAVELALEKDLFDAKITLDEIIETMWETAIDMNSKYKEISKGGLAVTVNITEC